MPVDLLDIAIREFDGIPDNVAKPALVFPIAIQLGQEEAERLQSQFRRDKLLGWLIVLLLLCIAFAALFAIIMMIARAV